PVAQLRERLGAAHGREDAFGAPVPYDVGARLREEGGEEGRGVEDEPTQGPPGRPLRASRGSARRRRFPRGAYTPRRRPGRLRPPGGTSGRGGRFAPPTGSAPRGGGPRPSRGGRRG